MSVNLFVISNRSQLREVGGRQEGAVCQASSTAERPGRILPNASCPRTTISRARKNRVRFHIDHLANAAIYILYDYLLPSLATETRL